MLFSKLSLKTFMAWGLLLFSLNTISCRYRFTNQHVRLPQGIRTIAFEAIFDTSQEVIPHEILWEELQRAFAADGHLLVVSQGRADALLRTRLVQASDAPIGSAELAESKDLRKIERRAGTDPAPKEFRTLSRAGEFTTKQAISVDVEVEVINLHSRQVIFVRSYQGSKTFRSFRSETTIAQKKSHFLLFEEARSAKMREMSTGIAQAVVRDFLIGI